ncbi:sensor histidine kinase KdpD, partial [Methanoregula sp.]|uniref:sensor histidine kinase n=1 Tax=Methanoregula sp. TaxID=2052170 RepID=UPI000CC4A6B0
TTLSRKLIILLNRERMKRSLRFPGPLARNGTGSSDPPAEEAIRQANRKLNPLDSVTRHDILNQITALQGYLPLMQETGADPKILEYLKRQEEIVTTIRQQIGFTKGCQEIGVNAPRWQEVEPVVSKAVGSSQFTQISVSMSAKGLELYADPLVENVFFIIADNALKHGHHVGEIRIRYEIRDQHLVVIIEDDGDGVKDTENEAIFRFGYDRHTGFCLACARFFLSMTGLTVRKTGSFGPGASFGITGPPGAFRFSEKEHDPAP